MQNGIAEPKDIFSVVQKNMTTKKGVKCTVSSIDKSDVNFFKLAKLLQTARKFKTKTNNIEEVGLLQGFRDVVFVLMVTCTSL